jgi:hypothetical protein
MDIPQSMNILATLLLLISFEPDPADSQPNRTTLIEERATIDTIRATGLVSAEYPQFVAKDERDGKLANEINEVLREDARRRVSSSLHSMTDSFTCRYVYTVSYFDQSIFSCRVLLLVNENAISSYAINYDIRNDGPLFLSKLVASVNVYDSLFARWRSKQTTQLPNTEDLTDLTWYVTPEGIGLMPKLQWPMSPERDATLIGFKDNADIFQRRLNVVDRALRE